MHLHIVVCCSMKEHWSPTNCWNVVRFLYFIGILSFVSVSVFVCELCENIFPLFFAEVLKVYCLPTNCCNVVRCLMFYYCTNLVSVRVFVGELRV